MKLLLFLLPTILAAQYIGTTPTVFPSSDGTVVGEFRMLELRVNGTDYVGFKPPNSLTGTLIWTMPNADGMANYCMITDGSLHLSFAACAAGSGGFPALDTAAIFQNNGDHTKQMRFDLGSLTTATTRILTIQDLDQTVAALEATQTFTGINTFRPPDGVNAFNVSMEVHANVNTSLAGFASHFARGTFASPVMPLPNDRIGFFGFSYWNGTNYNNVESSVQAYVDGAPVIGTSLPSDLEFFTTPVGTITRQLQVKINNAGIVTPAIDGAQNFGEATTPLRWGTGYFHNIDASAAGDLSSYLKSRYLYITDNTGAPSSASWRIMAESGSISSAFHLADQSGVNMLNITRLVSGSPTTPKTAEFDSDWNPMVNGIYSLGTLVGPPLRWNAALHNVDIDGTVTGVGIDCAQGTGPAGGGAVVNTCFALGTNAFGTDGTLGTYDNFSLIFNTHASDTSHAPRAIIRANGTITLGDITAPPAGFNVQVSGGEIISGAGQTSTVVFNPIGTLSGGIAVQTTDAVAGAGGYIMGGEAHGFFGGFKWGVTNGSGPVGDIAVMMRLNPTDATFSPLARFSGSTNTFLANNADFTVNGTTGRFTKVQELLFSDRLGGSSAIWRMDASSGSGSSDMCIADQGGACVLEMLRVFTGRSDTETFLDSDFEPTVTDKYKVGTPAREWLGGQFKDLTVTGTCIGCDSGGPYFDVKTYGSVCDGFSHPLPYGGYTVASFPHVTSAINRSNAALANGDEIDWAATMEAIGNAAQAITGLPGTSSGGIVQAPRGMCMVNKVIDLGNGTSTTNSTYNSLTFQGMGMGVAAPSLLDGGTVYQYIGTVNSALPLIRINGPVAGVFVKDILLDAADSLGYVIWSTHQYNGGGERITIHHPLVWGMKFDAWPSTTSVGVGANNNVWRQINIKMVDTCTAGGFQVGADSDTGPLDVARTDFYEIDVVGSPTACPSGIGNIMQLGYTDSEAVTNLYGFNTGPIKFRPPTGTGLATGFPLQIHFTNTYLNTVPIVDNTNNTWNMPAVGGITFSNYVEDGGGPTFPEIAGVRGFTAAGWHFGNESFVSHGTGGGIPTVTTMTNWHLGGSVGAAIEWTSTNTSTTNTSTIDPPNNLFSDGRIYGAYDAAGYANSKICVQNATALNTWVDGMCVKGGGIFTGFAGISGANFNAIDINTLGSDGGIQAWRFTGQHLASTPTGASGKGIIYFDGTHWQAFEGVTGPTPVLGGCSGVCTFAGVTVTGTAWNSLRSAGGASLSTSEFIGFAAPFDPISNPFSAAGQLVNGNWNMIQIQKDGNNAFYVADSYGSTGTLAATGFKGRSSRGSVISPSASQTGDNLVSLTGHGGTGAGVFSGAIFSVAGNAAILMQAAENFTTGANGTQILFQTTLNGTTTRSTQMQINNDGSVSVPGAGGMSVTNGFQAGAVLGLGGVNSTGPVQTGTSIFALHQVIDTSQNGFFHNVTVSGTCTGCGSGAVTSVSSSGNGMVVSPSTGAVFVGIPTSASPSFQGMTLTGILNAGAGASDMGSTGSPFLNIYSATHNAVYGGGTIGAILSAGTAQVRDTSGTIRGVLSATAGLTVANSGGTAVFQVNTSGQITTNGTVGSSSGPTCAAGHQLTAIGFTNGIYNGSFACN